MGWLSKNEYNGLSGRMDSESFVLPSLGMECTVSERNRSKESNQFLKRLDG